MYGARVWSNLTRSAARSSWTPVTDPRAWTASDNSIWRTVTKPSDPVPYEFLVQVVADLRGAGHLVRCDPDDKDRFLGVATNGHLNQVDASRAEGLTNCYLCVFCGPINDTHRYWHPLPAR